MMTSLFEQVDIFKWFAAHNIWWIKTIQIRADQLVDALSSPEFFIYSWYTYCSIYSIIFVIIAILVTTPKWSVKTVFD